MGDGTDVRGSAENPGLRLAVVSPVLHLIRAERTEGGKNRIDSFSDLRGEALQDKGINKLGLASLKPTCLPQ